MGWLDRIIKVGQVAYEVFSEAGSAAVDNTRRDISDDVTAYRLGIHRDEYSCAQNPVLCFIRNFDRGLQHSVFSRVPQSNSQKQ